MITYENIKNKSKSKYNNGNGKYTSRIECEHHQWIIMTYKAGNKKGNELETEIKNEWENENSIVVRDARDAMELEVSIDQNNAIEYYRKFADLVSADTLQLSSPGVVIFACHSGINRSRLAALFFLGIRCGKNLNQASELIRNNSKNNNFPHDKSKYMTETVIGNFLNGDFVHGKDNVLKNFDQWVNCQLRSKRNSQKREVSNTTNQNKRQKGPATK